MPQANYEEVEAPAEEAPVEPVAEAPAASEPGEVDFDLSFSAPSGETQDEAKDDNVIEFDVSLTESTILGNVGQELDDAEDNEPLAPMIDLSAIDLDLDSPSPATPEPVAPAVPDVPMTLDLSLDTDTPPAAINDEAQAHARQTETVVNPLLSMEDDDMTLPDFAMDSNEEVTTKLDLAKAYEDMGDLEGARELLQEVLKEGSPAQREKAQGLLAKLVS